MGHCFVSDSGAEEVILLFVGNDYVVADVGGPRPILNFHRNSIFVIKIT